MTGTQLAQAIKHEWPDMTVLLATGYADIVREDDIGLPKLTKPFFQRELADAIARVSPKRRKGGGVSHSAPDPNRIGADEPTLPWGNRMSSMHRSRKYDQP